MDKELLKSGLDYFGVRFTEEMAERFEKYMDFMLSYNEKVNLTRIVEPDEIVVKHFVDSISCVPHINEGASVIDVGSGAGFPGVPVKIARDDISLTLLDSLNKRVSFLNELRDVLGLSYNTVHSRAEDGGRNPKLREKYDVAVARAVASLDVLCEYCLPFVKVGGIFIAFKGRDANEEAAAAKKAINILGGKAAQVCEVAWGGLEHNLIIIEKIKSTPGSYPRKAGKPSKNPII